jgi:cytochrome bd-type quinol oxidase subunit 2
MSKPDIALLLVTALFGVYAWLSAMELGIAGLRLSARGGVSKDINWQLFTPLWEITNVFLVFGFTGFAVFFNNSLVAVSDRLFNVMALAITALLARACLVLYLYYNRNDLGWTVPNVLFLICSLLVPLSFGVIGLTLITGQLFWQSGPAAWLVLIMVSGLASLALSFMHVVARRKGSDGYYYYALMGGLLFAALGSVLVPALVRDNFIHLSGILLPFAVLMNLTLLSIAVTAITRRAGLLFGWLTFVTIATPALWAWANRPFLMFPGLIQTAYGAQAYDTAALIGIGIIFPIIALGLGLFAFLFTTPGSHKTH